jgi:hypothetical protein
VESTPVTLHKGEIGDLLKKPVAKAVLDFGLQGG